MGGGSFEAFPVGYVSQIVSDSRSVDDGAFWDGDFEVLSAEDKGLSASWLLLGEFHEH